MAEQATTQRKREKGTFIVQEQNTTGAPSFRDVDIGVEAGVPPKDRAACLKALRALGKPGTYRIAIVGKPFTLKTETVTKARFE
jgi:hypothetical protein